jgi:hypothetical protein
VPLFIPDFDVSFDEGLTLGLESLLAPAAVPEPAPAPATPGVFCAKATPEIIVRQVAATINFFIEASFVGFYGKADHEMTFPIPADINSYRSVR